MKKKFFIVVCLICISIGICGGFFTVKALMDSKDNLFGKVIYVDAGHGGKDDGASFSGVVEDEINLKIAGYLMEFLIDKGAYVLTTRTGDYDLSSMYDKNKKRNDLIKRVKQINESKVDLFISLHLNSYPLEKIRGAQVFYQNNDESKLLAKNLQKNLNDLSIGKTRNEKIGDYYILNKSNRVGALVECGFLSNDNERALLLNDKYQQKLASKIVTGIIDYFTILGR